MPGGHVSARSPLAVPYLCFTGDMSGDGVQDVVFLDCAMATVHIYKNEQDQVPAKPTPVGFGPNWTLY